MRLDWKGTAMIKKSIAIVSVIAAFLMGAGITAMYTAVQAGAGQEQTLSLNRINMDIEDADGRYYNALADVEIYYEQGKPIYMSVENPALLSFQLSSKYHGGIWLLNQEEGNQMLSDLKDMKEQFNQQGLEKYCEQVERMIQQLDNAGPVTGAGT